MVGRIDKKHKGKGKLVVAPGTGRLFKSMQKAKDRYDTQFSKLSEHMSSSYEKKQHKANAAPPPRETVVVSGTRHEDKEPIETGAPPPPEARVTLPLRGGITAPRGPIKERLTSEGKVQHIEPPPKISARGMKMNVDVGSEVNKAPKKNIAPKDVGVQRRTFKLKEAEPVAAPVAVAAKPKKTISPEHLAKMAAGRARAKAEKEARK